MARRQWINKEQIEYFLNAFKNQDYALIKECIDKNWEMPVQISNVGSLITGLTIACGQDSLTSVKMIMEDMEYNNSGDIATCITELIKKQTSQTRFETLYYLLNPSITDQFNDCIKSRLIDSCRYDINDLKLLKQFDFKFVNPYRKENTLTRLISSTVWDEEFEFLLNNYDRKTKRIFFNDLVSKKNNITDQKLNVLTSHFQKNKEDYDLFYKFCHFYANRVETEKTKERKQISQNRLKLFGSIKTYLELQEKIPNIKTVKRSNKI